MASKHQQVKMITEDEPQQIPPQIVNSEDKAEPIKNELPAGYSKRADLLRQEIQKRINDAAAELHNSTRWIVLNAQFSQTKQLPFQNSHRASDFWKSNVANDAQDMFKALFPRKLIIGLMNQTNTVMKSKYSNEPDSEIRKRLYKIEQFYEYFGIKILMGYNRMPSPEDYFNESLTYRSKICELIKRGRFNFIENFTEIKDEILMQFKVSLAKEENLEFQKKHKIDGEVIPYLMKKLNKVNKLACDPGQNLILIRDSFFDCQDIKSNEAIFSLLLIDARTLFIVSSTFTYEKNLNNSIFRMLEPFRNKNHRLYLDRELMNLDEVNQLAMQFQIFPSCILAKSPNDEQIKFDAELITNNQVQLLKLKYNDQRTNILASTADGFHKNSQTDKRAYATVQLQEMLKKAQQIILQSDQYRSQFQVSSQNSLLFTQVQELIIWNSYIAYKEIQRIDPTIEFLQFRLLLAKKLLDSKLKLLPQSSTQTHIQSAKSTAVAVNTDITGNFGSQTRDNLPHQNFHIPTILIAPAALQGALVCLVCHKNTYTLTQCKPCSEDSLKLISLCASECFSIFHANPSKYTTGAEDIPVLNTTTQFEQSNIAQLPNYHKSYEAKRKQQNYQMEPQFQEPAPQYEPNIPYTPEQAPARRGRPKKTVQFQEPEFQQFAEGASSSLTQDKKAKAKTKFSAHNQYLLEQQMDQLEGL